MSNSAQQSAAEPYGAPRDSKQSQPGERACRLSRRTLLIGGASGVAAGAIYPLAKFFARKEPVFLARKQRYDGSLCKTIADGMAAVGFDPAVYRGKRVLLKPNLVEPRRDAPHLCTHPAVVLAAAEVFRRHGALVTVGEAPGHIRDTQWALDESGMGEALEGEKVAFADLNYQDARAVKNAGRVSPLSEIFFPRAVHEADLIVSMPKLKTHHWVGMTAAMKNLYGLLPGIKYGWPKNVLHHAGIPQTVVDINASAPRTIGIVDAIECMEGDGPILGTARQLGMIAVSANLPALDATCARVIGLEPSRISYLELASKLGPVAERQIPQRGEPWEKLRSPFQILELPHLLPLRAENSGALIS